jgi:site-specific DNA-methyltransferase (adenine-specific)
MEAESVHAIVTDPPYGLAFMGKRWDYDVPSVEIWAECLRVLKPGGHLLAFAGTRTQHRMACRIEDAGFEIRDMIAWVYGSGFPKSLDVSKAIDKAAGAEREVVGSYTVGGTAAKGKHKGRAASASDEGAAIGCTKDLAITAPATPEAQQWAGWGTALKPALEPITMARKPLAGTVAANVLEHGTGGLNVDGCRVAHDEDCRMMAPSQANIDNPSEKHRQAGRRECVLELKPGGRWPANLIHDGSNEVVGLFPETMGGNFPANGKRSKGTDNAYGAFNGKEQEARSMGDTGSAARFFYTAKASAAERQGVTHPTVKPLDLMAYLCRLVTPPGGIVLDPFAGSGTTLKAAISEGFQAIGIERDPDYHAMAERRLNGAQLGLSIDI